MKFTSIPVSDKKYLNYIFLEIAVGNKPVTAMFDTRGNTLIKQSIADQIDINYIDEVAFDDKRGYRRARVNLRLGGLEIGSAPVVVAKDESFELIKDPLGNEFPADAILGRNIISQLSFRGDLRIGSFEVQVDDFREQKDKGKRNAPILYIEFDGERTLAAIDSSAPVTSVSRQIFEKIVESHGRSKDTIDMLGIENSNLTYETAIKFKIDQDEIILPSAQLNQKLNNNQIQIVFGADLLRNTTWAIYGPMKYIRARQR